MVISELMKNPKFIFLINLGLLLFGLVVALSGLSIQLGYHYGHHREIETGRFVLGLNYSNWTGLHKISIILVSIGLFFHVILHWKWYKAVVANKKLVVKNQQVIILTILFIFIAVTGYISWFIKLRGGPETSRNFYMESHDKITWVLLVYLFLHIKKRFKWYLAHLPKKSAMSEGLKGSKSQGRCRGIIKCLRLGESPIEGSFRTLKTGEPTPVGN